MIRICPAQGAGRVPAGKLLKTVALGSIYVLLPLLTLYGFFLWDRPVYPEPVFAVTEASFVISHASHPPETGWEPLLSADLEGPPEAEFYSAWFRIDLADHPDADAFYIPFPAANVEVWLDVRRIFQSGAMERPLPYLRSPLLEPIPSSQGAAPRWLYLRIARQAPSLVPPQLYIGPFPALLPAYEDRRFNTAWLQSIVLGISATIIFIVGGLFLLHRQETAYGWYALTMTVWALHSAHTLIDNIPFHHDLWFALNYLCAAWVVAELIFINRFFKFHTPRVERFVFVVTAALSLGLVGVAVLGDTFELAEYAQYLFLPWIILCALYIGGQYFAAVLTRRSFESIALWLQSSSFVVVGIRDYLFEFEDLPIPGSMYYLQYTVLLPLAVFAFLLVRRHVLSLRTAETLSRSLETKVEEKSRDLARSYADLVVEEKKRTLAEERTRLMRDMHDGLGGQLVYALSMSEENDNPEMSNALRYALEDLRLIVDSLAPHERTLSSMLYSFRHRTVKTISRSGISMVWDIDTVESVEDPSPERILGLLRIVQEAVTNAVRHSGCTTLTIAVSSEPSGVRVDVSDDGSGIRNGSPGRGLGNMRVRAVEINAALDIFSDSTGTRVTCVLNPADAL